MIARVSKRCLITGSASGIGSALVDRFKSEGYEVLGVDVDPTPNARSIAADLSSLEDIQRVVRECGVVDVAIHCAGTSSVGPFESGDGEQEGRVIDVNLEAPIQLTTQLLRTRALRSGGSLVFVASLSNYVGYPGASVYAASKDGLASYARSLSVALAPRRIHVATVYPGPTRTPHARRFSPDPEHESGRMPPERVAGAVYHGVRRRLPTIVPGMSNKFLATLGHLAPGFMSRMMRKFVYDRLVQG